MGLNALVGLEAIFPEQPPAPLKAMQSERDAEEEISTVLLYRLRQ